MQPQATSVLHFPTCENPFPAIHLTFHEHTRRHTHKHDQTCIKGHTEIMMGWWEYSLIISMCLRLVTCLSITCLINSCLSQMFALAFWLPRYDFLSLAQLLTSSRSCCHLRCSSLPHSIGWIRLDELQVQGKAAEEWTTTTHATASCTKMGTRSVSVWFASAGCETCPIWGSKL